jgi:hypothetical protein
MALGAITVDTMRTAFALYAQSHEAASIQRCWSTWNVLCTFLYTAELIASNPMPMVGRPKLAKTRSGNPPRKSLRRHGRGVGLTTWNRTTEKTGGCENSATARRLSSEQKE